MFVNSTRLPYLLAPSSYFSPEQFEREITTVFVPGWHVLATMADLPASGDYITCELFGRPLLLRNIDGAVHAFANVCAHRHSLLTSQPKGHSDKLRCQYHGWEYDAQGRTGKIPDPKSFQPFDRKLHCLTKYRVATCGQLVFVSLDPHGPSLPDALGPFFQLCADRFNDTWRQFMALDFEYPVNWKVPVENALEAYHVPYIHPHSFREDPGEQRATHLLGDDSTSYGTQLPFSSHSRADAWFQRCEGGFLRLLGVTPTGTYRHHHIFPQLLFSFTDTISLCNCVIPTSATTSRAVIRQFSRCDVRWPVWRRMLASGWGRLAGQITQGIQREDMRLYPDIQRGLTASQQPGVLGRCEERIYAFQKYLVRRCGGGVEPHAADLPAGPANPDAVDFGGGDAPDNILPPCPDDTPRHDEAARC